MRKTDFIATAYGTLTAAEARGERIVVTCDGPKMGVVQSDKSAELSSTPDITYNFKVRDPEMINITGSVTINIDGGAMKAECSGKVEIVATYQG